MIDHDRLFKELLTTFFVEFLQLFLPEVAGFIEPDTIEFLDKEIFTDVTTGERHEVDVLALVRFKGNGIAFLIHVEDQNQPQAGFSCRMFTYFSRLTEKMNRDVYPIALFTYDAPQRAEPSSYEVVFPNRIVLQFAFDAIQLNRLNWRDYMHQSNPIASALMAKMAIAPEDRPRVKVECLRLLATLRLDPARMKMISGFVDTYLRLNAEELVVFNQELSHLLPEEEEKVLQITTSWMEEGLQQGGEKIVQRQLRRRLGELPASIEVRIHRLHTVQLEELAEALLDFSTMDDLTTWLDQNEAR
jgi:hypothetical protein